MIPGGRKFQKRYCITLDVLSQEILIQTTLLAREIIEGSHHVPPQRSQHCRFGQILESSSVSRIITTRATFI